MNGLSPLVAVVRAEIERSGPIPFDRFMGLALYHPEHGYYERRLDQTGRSGDFYTSVSVGSLFGRLLAARFRYWWESAGMEHPMVVEVGAHDGQLAADVLGALAVPGKPVAEVAAYWIIEPSPRREAVQRRKLQDYSGTVHWVRSFEELRGALGGREVQGVIFANELLDAQPVRRLGWDAGRRRWFEWAVAWNGIRFEFQPAAGFCGAPPTGVKWDWLCRLPAPLQAAIPNGFTVEVGTAAEDWWTAAASVLERGWLVGVDYGFETEACLAPDRATGTLRGYRSHRLVADVLDAPGEMDLTASVDFGSLRFCGERAGLRTNVLQSQEAFLAEALRLLALAGADSTFTPSERRQLQTLLHPAHLGRAFRVLVQGKGVATLDRSPGAGADQ